MDYKKIIRSAKSREAILNLIRFIPDSPMLKLQYRIKTGRGLNLTKPRRFTEKLQWYKRYYHDPQMRNCIDKFLVRRYVQEKGLEKNLVPIYGHYKDINQVNFDVLPEQFVIKTTNGGGGLNVVVVTDKERFITSEDKSKLRAKVWRTRSGGREWAYYGLKPGIIVEQLLINAENPQAGINDYKIFCFNGKAECIVVDVDRYIGHKRDFYDTQWNNLNIKSDCDSIGADVRKPDNLDEMLRIAEKLSEDFPFVRVDLYNINEKIYFGELTFYPWSGYVKFSPDDFDFELGDKFVLPEKLCKDN